METGKGLREGTRVSPTAGTEASALLCEQARLTADTFQWSPVSPLSLWAAQQTSDYGLASTSFACPETYLARARTRRCPWRA